MPHPIYEKLIPALNSRGTTIPAVNCPEYFALVEFLFTPEEAEIFYAMPHGFASAEAIASNMNNIDVQVLSGKLESMCDKGLIQSREEGGKKLYEAMPFLPGIMELQILKGMGGERQRKVVQLFNSYRDALRKLKKSGASPRIEMPAAGTRLAIDKDIYNTGAIIPYEEMKELIMNTEYMPLASAIVAMKAS